uniref:Uncharacterized protein n=1 Tax=Arundo donax TaxID=35708 RepID=A0A0A9FHC1_ARUDO
MMMVFVGSSHPVQEPFKLVSPNICPRKKNRSSRCLQRNFHVKNKLIWCGNSYATFP